MNPRETLIQRYKDTGEPPALEDISDSNGRVFTRASFDGSPRLATLLGLTLDEALELLAAYGKGLVFTHELETELDSYAATRKRIAEIERKRGGPASS